MDLYQYTVNSFFLPNMHTISNLIDKHWPGIGRRGTEEKLERDPFSHQNGEKMIRATTIMALWLIHRGRLILLFLLFLENDIGAVE